MPLDDAYRRGGVGHVEAGQTRSLGPQLVADIGDVRHQPRRRLHRIHRLRRERRVRRLAAHAAAPAVHALVRDRRHHGRGFADDAQPRRQPTVAQVGNEMARTEATHLFVVAEGIVQREGQVGFQPGGGLRHHQADPTLHVGAAAAVEAAVAHFGRQWVRLPVLAVPGYGVGVARQHQPARLAHAERGKEVGLAALLVPGQPQRHAQRAKVVGDALDERQVRCVADGVEANQALRPGQAVGVGSGGVHGGTVAAGGLP